MAEMAREANHMLGFSATVLQWMGMWQPPGLQPSWPRTYLARFIASFNALMPLGCAGNLAFDMPADSARTRDIIFLLFTTFAWAVRICSFIMEKNRLQGIVIKLMDARKKYTEDGTNIRYRYWRHVIIFSIIWQMAPLPTLMMWLFDPMLSYMVASGPDENFSEPRQLVIWVPMDTAQSPDYEIAYGLEIVFNFVAVEANILFDVFIVVLMILIAGELAVLNQNIKSMTISGIQGRRIESENSFPLLVKFHSVKTESRQKRIVSESPLLPKSINDGDLSPFLKETSDMHRHLYMRLVKNIQHHQITLKCVSELQIVMSKTIFFILFLNAVNICVQAFGLVELIQGGANKTAALKKVLGLPVYMSQTALYCLYGQEIMDQSERLQDSAFSCPWSEADPSFCRSLRIFMLQVSRPLRITIGKVIVLSRNTFMQIINTSYTIFNMMINF